CNCPLVPLSRLSRQPKRALHSHLHFPACSLSHHSPPAPKLSSAGHPSPVPLRSRWSIRLGVTSRGRDFVESIFRHWSAGTLLSRSTSPRTYLGPIPGPVPVARRPGS